MVELTSAKGAAGDWGRKTQGHMRASERNVFLDFSLREAERRKRGGGRRKGKRNKKGAKGVSERGGGPSEEEGREMSRRNRHSHVKKKKVSARRIIWGEIHW